MLFTAFPWLGIFILFHFTLFYFILFMTSCRFLNTEASHLVCDIVPMENLIKLPLMSAFTLLHQGDRDRSTQSWQHLFAGSLAFPEDSEVSIEQGFPQ